MAIDDKKIEDAINVLKSIQSLDDLKENKEEVLNIIEGFIVYGVKILKDILTKSLAPDEVQKELENFQVGQEAFGEELEKEMDRISEIPGADIPEEIWRSAGLSANGLGTGGMVTKLQAAELARRSGAKVVIAQGAEPDVLVRVAAGEQVGTHFQPSGTTLESRKRFILAGGQAIGALHIDQGAYLAIQKGGSLLPVGIVKVEGEFWRGDTVGVFEPSGKEIAKGLSNYASRDLDEIRGKRSDQIEKLLGFAYGEEVIHRNNMVLL